MTRLSGYLVTRRKSHPARRQGAGTIAIYRLSAGRGGRHKGGKRGVHQGALVGRVTALLQVHEDSGWLAVARCRRHEEY